ncbi:hypothetical protein D3C80_1303730 [compost metagenome]
MTLANGAKQFVVQDAFETTKSVALASVWFTPITNIGASADGAEIITFLAPPLICSFAVSTVVKIPVHSATTSTSTSFHFKSAGFLSAVIRMFLPFTNNFPSFTSTVPSKRP